MNPEPFHDWTVEGGLSSSLAAARVPPSRVMISVAIVMYGMCVMSAHIASGISALTAVRFYRTMRL